MRSKSVGREICWWCGSSTGWDAHSHTSWRPYGDLSAPGVGFRSLQEQIDTSTSGGNLIFHIFASLAEVERDLIKERTNAGLQAARARGRKGGRPKGGDQKKQKAAIALKKEAGHSIREICEIVGISRNTYYKYTRSDGSTTLPKA